MSMQEHMMVTMKHQAEQIERLEKINAVLLEEADKVVSAFHFGDLDKDVIAILEKAIAQAEAQS